MQKGHVLHFECQKCHGEVDFSIFELDRLKGIISCPTCREKYLFHDENLRRQLEKFEKLCRQIVESEEILSDTCVGIDIEGRQVKVPYKILLARLSSTLNLTVGDQPLSIDFRLEPLEDIPKFIPETTPKEPVISTKKIPLKFSVSE